MICWSNHLWFVNGGALRYSDNRYNVITVPGGIIYYAISTENNINIYCIDYGCDAYGPDMLHYLRGSSEIIFSCLFVYTPKTNKNEDALWRYNFWNSTRNYQWIISISPLEFHWICIPSVNAAYLPGFFFQALKFMVMMARVGSSRGLLEIRQH